MAFDSIALQNEISTCIVVPCYNEQERLQVASFKDFIASNNIHFCFVNDGSSDNTIGILKSIQSVAQDRVLILNKENNQGKAEAVRNGVLESLNWKKFDLIGYFDADLATPLGEIPKLIKEYQKSANTGFILGSRVGLLGKNIKRSKKRHYFGRVFATLASIILKLPVYDTQCGAKIIRADMAIKIFEKPFITSWLFDVELIARTLKIINKKERLSYFVEFPLDNWEEIGGSKIKLKHLIMVPYQLLAIYLKYRK